MKIELSKVMTYTPILITYLYGIGEAKHEGYISSFDINVTGYQLDLVQGITNGILTMYTASFWPLMAGYASAVLMVFIAELSSTLFNPQKPSFITSKLKLYLIKIKSIFTSKASDNIRNDTQKKERHDITIYMTISIMLIIYLITLLLLNLSLTSGKSEANSFKERSDKTLYEINYNDDHKKLTAYQVYCGNNFCAFMKQDNSTISIPIGNIKSVIPKT